MCPRSQEVSRVCTRAGCLGRGEGSVLRSFVSDSYNISSIDNAGLLFVDLNITIR